MLTVVCDVLVDVLVTTLIVGGGVLVIAAELELIVVASVSLEDVPKEVLESLVVPGNVVGKVVNIVVCCVVTVVFGNRESTMPIGPVKSTSESGQINSSG